MQKGNVFWTILGMIRTLAKYVRCTFLAQESRVLTLHTPGAKELFHAGLIVAVVLLWPRKRGVCVASKADNLVLTA